MSPSAPEFPPRLSDEPADEGPPLAGREPELQTLVTAIRRVSTNGPGLVLVEGLTHVGKTRLVREALAAVPELRCGWARVPAAPEVVPGQVFTAAVRQATGEVPTAELRAIDDGPAEILGEVLRRHAPVALVLEDLHQGGALGSLRVLAQLRMHLIDIPLVVIGTYRSEEVDFAHPLRCLAATTRVRLAPLRAAELRAVSDDPVALLARTGGYGAYVAAWLAGQRSGVPSGDLLAAVLGRCQAAGPRAYRIALAASMLRQPFGPDDVAAATGMDRRTIAEECDRLTLRGLLHDRGERGFAFACTLLLDALATQVSTARRRILAAGVMGEPARTQASRRR